MIACFSQFNNLIAAWALLQFTFPDQFLARIRRFLGGTILVIMQVSSIAARQASRGLALTASVQMNLSPALTEEGGAANIGAVYPLVSRRVHLFVLVQISSNDVLSKERRQCPHFDVVDLLAALRWPVALPLQGEVDRC